MFKGVITCRRSGGSSLRCFSSSNLQPQREQQVNNILFDNKNIPRTRDDPKIIDIHSTSTSSTTPSQNKLYLSLQQKSLQGTQKVTSFLRGPLKFNAQVAWELASLFLREQKIVPELKDWPVARASYIANFNWIQRMAFEGKDQLISRIRASINEMTWGDLGKIARISAEMAAFYYIGQLIGLTASFIL